MVKFLLALMIVLLPLMSSVEAAPKKSGKKRKVDRKSLRVNKGDVQSSSELKENVKSYRSSKRIDGIPMVDQKNRAYCAVATVQRHLKYYFPGSSVSLKNLARAMRADRDKGTDIAFMVSVLEKYSSELRLNFQGFYAVESGKLLQKYNKDVARNKRLDLASGKLSSDDFEDIIPKIEYKTWKQLRLEEKSQRRKAWKYICDNIDDGIPVTWCVWLGLRSEKGRKLQPGGHMRMIIGYDSKKDRIIYTDSWGNDHARKEMDWDDAWAITSHLITLKPRR